MKQDQKTGAGQVVLKLRQIEVQTAQFKSLAIACREAEISEQSDSRWRKKYGGLQIDQDRRMKDLKRENARLRQLVSDLFLEKQVLVDVAAGERRPAPAKLIAPERRRQAVDGIREKYGLSERHACRIVGQHRGTQRYVPTVPADEDALTLFRR